MNTSVNEEVWRSRFINRTHDTELYRIGALSDPELFHRVYTREYRLHKDYADAVNTAKTHVVWLGFETMTQSRMLAKYN